jgi:hypothetical protein
MIFPLSQHVRFQLLSCPFFLNSFLFFIYFTLLLPIFSCSFPVFLLHSPPVSLPHLIFFLIMTFAETPPPLGGAIFSIIDPCLRGILLISNNLSILFPLLLTTEAQNNQKLRYLLLLFFVIFIYLCAYVAHTFLVTLSL